MWFRLFQFFNKIFNKQNRYNYSTLATESPVKPIQITAKNFNATIVDSGLAKEGVVSLIGDFVEVIGFSTNYFFVLDINGKLFVIKSKFEIIKIESNLDASICQLFNPETIEEKIVTQNFTLKDQDIFKTIFKNVECLNIDTIEDSFEFLNNKRIFGVKWITNSSSYYSGSQLSFFDKTNWTQVSNLEYKDSNNLFPGDICVLEQEQCRLLVEIVSLDQENITMINRQRAIEYLKNKIEFDITQCYFSVSKNSSIFYKV